ncbi:MAG TPA: MarR family transcriptional regulator, partial [Limnochordia bacterium]|nr:MarR family transcriptional regulator [Limnochordia bacterium]
MDLLSKIPILNEPNPRLVLRLVREAESVSRADLARATGLHPSTITRLVAALLEAGLLQESGEGQNDLGR